MKIECPGCGVSGTAEDSYQGRKIRCPKCSEVFACTLESEVTEDSANDLVGISEPVTEEDCGDGNEPGDGEPDMKAPELNEAGEESDNPEPLPESGTSAESEDVPIVEEQAPEENDADEAGEPAEKEKGGKFIGLLRKLFTRS